MKVTLFHILKAIGQNKIPKICGQGPEGRPNIHDVKLMTDVLDEMDTDWKLKVSGVIESRILNPYAFMQMGASRIGTKGAVKIVDALSLVQERLYKE